MTLTEVNKALNTFVGKSGVGNCGPIDEEIPPSVAALVF
jgi:hypothetical protein